MTVAHLPKENSRVTKFLFARGARVFTVLTSANYCVSPLVQGGLEIPCRIEIHMLLTMENKELIRIYESQSIPSLSTKRRKHRWFFWIRGSAVSGQEQEDKRELKKKIATKNEKQDGMKYKISGVFL